MRDNARNLHFVASYGSRPHCKWVAPMGRLLINVLAVLMILLGAALWGCLDLRKQRQHVLCALSDGKWATGYEICQLCKGKVSPSAVYIVLYLLTEDGYLDRLPLNKRSYTGRYIYRLRTIGNSYGKENARHVEL